MEETVLYQKEGRRYKPIGNHIEHWSLYPIGAHLIIVRPGVRSTIRSVDIDAAGVQAAMKIAADAMVAAMLEASKLKPTNQSTPITVEQRALLDQLEATGFNTSHWQWASMAEVVEAGIKELKAVASSE